MILIFGVCYLILPQHPLETLKQLKQLSGTVEAAVHEAHFGDKGQSGPKLRGLFEVSCSV